MKDFSSVELMIGAYLPEGDRLTIEREYPDIKARWDAWLDAQRDPGHYDAYKERDQSVLPYIDGHPQWVCDVFMPAELVRELKSRLESNQ